MKKNTMQGNYALQIKIALQINANLESLQDPQNQFRFALDTAKMSLVFLTVIATLGCFAIKHQEFAKSKSSFTK